MIGSRQTRRKAAPLGGGQPGAPDAPLKYRPLPSAVDGNRWTVDDSRSVRAPAFVERVSGQGRMRVPLDGSPTAHRIRLHEMAHVRWTPMGLAEPGVEHATMNAVEDRRMHKRLKEIGMGDPLMRAPIWPEGSEQWDRLVGDLPKMSDLDVARLVAATDLTYESKPLRRILTAHGKGWIPAVTDALMDEHGMNGRRPAASRTAAAAAALEAAFREPEGDEPDPRPGDEEMREMMGPPDRRSEVPKWGTMRLVSVPLSQRLPTKMRRRTRRASDTGAVPRNWHRLPVDGRVFTERRKRPGGGTVLVDLSGSMSLTTDEVDALIAMYPAVTIAVYAGSSTTGQLKVIARKGHRCSRELVPFEFGGNIIDGPALDWLGTQDGPRIWVSDGYVTGHHDSHHPALVLDAGRKMSRYGIRRVDRFGKLVGSPEAIDEDS